MCKIVEKHVHVDCKPDNVFSLVVMIRIGHLGKGKKSDATKKGNKKCDGKVLDTFCKTFILDMFCCHYKKVHL